MAGQFNDTFGPGSETPSRFVIDTSTTPGLWSLGLKTGLTPQHLAPLNTGTHHKLEVNPFEASYAHISTGTRPSDEAAPEQFRRPRINELQIAGAGPEKDSSTSNDSRSSNESRSMSMTTYDTPPSDVPLSPVAIKPITGTQMLSMDGMSRTTHGLHAMGGAIDASAYAEHLARYVRAQAVHATRTSAPLAGQSTSKPPSPFDQMESPEMDSGPFDADAASVGSADYLDDEDVEASVDLPAALSNVQAAAAEPPRKKAATPAKSTSPAKRGKVGRPRNVKEDEIEEMTPEESKRKDFLERNRQAACKSRQKRKAWQANLETEAHRLTESNGQLQSLVATLREEIAGLRATVAGHAANGCQAARLALQAARPGDVPMAAFVLPSSSVAMQHSPSMGHHGGATDIFVGQSMAPMDGVISYHQPSAMEVQRSRSGHGPMPELTPSYQMGAGANFFDVNGAAGLTSQPLLGRSSDVDLSAYLA